MLSVKGEFQNGVATPVTAVEGREGQAVIITFLEDETARTNGSPHKAEPTVQEDGWEDLLKLVQACQTATGIGDLAHEHDHYIHGTPKRNDR